VVKGIQFNEFMKNDIIDPVVEEAFQKPSSPKNILIFAPLAYSTPHFETDLEIAKRQIDIGNNVHFVPCLAELPSCRLNPNHEKSMCERCMSRSIQGMERLLPDIQIHQLGQLNEKQYAVLQRLPQSFSTIEALSNFRIENMDAGMAAKSTLIDFIQEPEFDPAKYANILLRLMQATFMAYFSIQNLIDNLKIDEVFIYNGRWASSRGALRAAESKSVDYYLHERGASKDKFSVVKNYLIHDMYKTGERAGLLWEKNESNVDCELGSRFYINQRLGKEKKWYSSIKKQEHQKVPENWDDYSRRVIFYTSSEFELSSIGDEVQGIYPDQITAIKDLCETVQNQPNTHVWIRMHPNDKQPSRRQYYKEQTRSIPNATMLYSNEEYDSYYILTNASLVVTEFSTIGAEATFWGVPSISLGKSGYNYLGAAHTPKSIEEAKALFVDENLPCKSRKASLIYGLWRDSYGELFKHIKTDKISDFSFGTTFMNSHIKPRSFSHDISKLQLFPAFVGQKIHALIET